MQFDIATSTRPVSHAKPIHAGFFNRQFFTLHLHLVILPEFRKVRVLKNFKLHQISTADRFKIKNHLVSFGEGEVHSVFANGIDFDGAVEYVNGSLSME